MCPVGSVAVTERLAQGKQEVIKAYTYQGLSVLLLPARTDTRWFHDYCYMTGRTTVKFIKGRLKFGDGKAPAPFPFMLVIFHAKS